MPHPNRPRPSQLHHHQTHGAEPDAQSARQGLLTTQAKGRRMGRGLPRQPHRSVICSPDCPGVGRGAQAGVLIKNAEALERMEKVDTLVVDKTGTLTEGKPAVTQITPAPGFDEREVLRLAASVERASEHPLALAIVTAADTREIATAPVSDFDSPVGRGALGKVAGRRIVL